MIVFPFPVDWTLPECFPHSGVVLSVHALTLIGNHKIYKYIYLCVTQHE